MTTYRPRLDRLAAGVLTALSAVVVVDELFLSIPVLRPVLVVVLVGLVPGALFLSVVDVEPTLSARWLVYAVASSLLLFMGLGFLVNLLFPLVGVTEPLGPAPMLFGLLLLVGGLIALDRRLHAADGPRRLTVTVDTGRLEIPAFLLFPLLAAVAVTRLNVTGDNTLLLVVLVGAAAVPFVVALAADRDDVLPFGLWCLGLALLYHASLWRGFVFGGHAYVIGIYESLHFSVENIELLANAVVWPATARLSGIHVLTQLKVVNPMLVALVPVAIFVTARTYTDHRRAFLAAGLFAFAHPFYFLYPTAGRVATPVFFLAVLGAVISDPVLDLLQKRLLSIVAALGIILSHYGTSYYVMYAILLALGLLLALQFADRLAEALQDRIADRAVGDGGTRFVRPGFDIRVLLESQSVLNWKFAGFYAVGAVAWYMLAGDGAHFVGLVENMQNAYDSLMTAGGQGSTATRLTTDYGTTSIAFSKLLYVVVSGLLAVGLAATYYRRVHPDRDQPFDDQFLAFGTAALVLFTGTFIVSGAWGGGRPMMIVFSLTAVYAVLGAETLGTAPAFLERHLRGRSVPVAVSRRLSPRNERRVSAAAAAVGSAVATVRSARVGWQAGFATLLAVMLLVNSGAAAAVVLGGFAPSNVPLQQQLADSPSPNHNSLQYIESDIRTQAWLADHRDDSLAIYGDRLARAQTTDRYNGEILAVSERDPYRFKQRNHLHNALPNLRPGYVVLLGHNVEHGTMSLNYVQWRQLDDGQLQLDRRSKVYANDHGAVYYTSPEADTPEL